MTRKTLLSLGICLTLILTLSFSLEANPKDQIRLNGKPLSLIGKRLQIGEVLPKVSLPDTFLEMVNLHAFIGKVTILSVVPSINTPTCEKQTHILSEENNGLDKTVHLITISRDLPFAQKRFSKEANIENIQFLSDYRSGEFGTRTGLLIEENRLLARAMIVLDRTGVIRYIEIVKELGHLPDMNKAFIAASSL
jgi:thioredoxin-dependent peroxiredoxin